MLPCGHDPGCTAQTTLFPPSRRVPNPGPRGRGTGIVTHLRTRPPPALEDLRLPCPHGMWTPHQMTHPRLERCPSGRVPTRQELIAALDGRPIAWCVRHNAVRDHHHETDECQVTRSFLLLGGGT